MAKKITDKNGNVYVETKPWYKRWWIWVIIVVILIVLFVMMGGNSGSDHSSKSGKGSVSTSSPSTTIDVDYNDYKISSEKTYKSNYTDNSWNGGTLKINKVVVYKTARPYKFDSANDGKFKVNGFIRLFMSVKAKDDISIYPTQGNYSYSNGEQHGVDSDENWDGDIDKGSTKSGHITVPVKNLKNTSSIKSIRCKFDANAQDTDDDSLDKTFDFTINLKG